MEMTFVLAVLLSFCLFTVAERKEEKEERDGEVCIDMYLIVKRRIQLFRSRRVESL